MREIPKYTAVIRTLGTAEEKYQMLLDSLMNQTIKPQKILVYLADGYDMPRQTVGAEEIIYVPKGMVAQRALQYSEVCTEWILFLDDDMSIEPDGVERLFSAALEHNADVVAVDSFPHDKLPLIQKITMAILLSALPRIIGRNKGYTVSLIGTDWYNPCPGTIGWSTTNAGNAFICRKKDFLKINFAEELWLDESPYAIPDDKVMFFKMHLQGLKILTHFNAGFTHLDAQTSTGDSREAKIEYSIARNNLIFFRKYVLPNIPVWKKCMVVYPILAYKNFINMIYRVLKGNKYSKERKLGIKNAKEYLKSIRK